MKRVAMLLLAVIFLFGVCGCHSLGTDSIPSLNMPTLKSLVELHGEGFTWDTLAPYYYEEASDGALCVLRYPIDKEYALVIGGVSRDEPPAYVRLVLVRDPQKYVDVRSGSIDDFIAANG